MQCVIGANIKLMGSVAFDAAPAFIGTLLLGPMYGAVLGIFGHLTSALLAGFPLTTNSFDCRWNDGRNNDRLWIYTPKTSRKESTRCD